MAWERHTFTGPVNYLTTRYKSFIWWEQ